MARLVIETTYADGRRTFRHVETNNAKARRFAAEQAARLERKPGVIKTEIYEERKNV